MCADDVVLMIFLMPFHLTQEVAAKLTALDETDSAVQKVVKPCSLDKPTQALVKLIFDNDMFQDAMKSMEIGKLT